MKKVFQGILCLAISFMLIMMLVACGTANNSGQSRKGDNNTQTVDTTPDSGTNTDTKETNTNDDTKTTPIGSKSIVIYFSRTNNTERIAAVIIEETGSDSYEILAKVPYTDDDIKYYTDCRTDREQNDPTARPEIGSETINLSSYDVIYLGYPIWHGQAPKIMYTFVESYDLDGKTIVPFCTSASSGIGSSATNLAQSAPSANWLTGRRFSSSAEKSEVATWLVSIQAELPENNTFTIKIGGADVPVTWEENASVNALKAITPLTIQMSMYGGFEQVGPIGQNITRNDIQTTTQAGDIVLYSGNQIVIFYGSNTWSYTKLGHINLPQSEMTKLLGNGNVTIEIK